MKWHKITVKTTTEAEDIIICTLADVGLEGAQIEDKIPLTPLEKEQMFVDILPQTEEDDGVAYLNFFVEVDVVYFLTLAFAAVLLASRSKNHFQDQH